MRTYEKYKDSGISWIGKVPDGWEVCKVKHHYRLVTGFTPATKVAEFYDSNNGHTWITIADLKGKVVTDSTNKISDYYLREYHQEKVKKGSLLYSFKLSVGQVAFAGKDLYTNEAIAAFQNTTKVNLPFFFYAAPLFIIHNSNINIYGAHILNQDLIKNAYTVFPPLSEQEAIANYLDKKTAEIDKIIAEREKKIELLNELKSSIISRAVTKGINPHVKMKDSGIDWIGEIPEHWNLVRCKFLTKGYKSGPFGSSLITNKLLHDGHILVYTPEHVAKQSVNIDSNLFLPDERASEMSQFFVHPGEILFPIVGTLGRAMVITKDMPKGIINQRLAKFSINNRKLDTIFFLYLFAKCQSYQYYFYERCRGSIIVNLTKDILSDMPIVLPPLSEQVSIVNYLLKKSAEFDSTITSLKKECVLYKEYKQSLISEVVTGKRKVID